MCQVQIARFICCCSSPPHIILAEGEMPNAITPKTPWERCTWCFNTLGRGRGCWGSKAGHSRDTVKVFCQRSSTTAMPLVWEVITSQLRSLSTVWCGATRPWENQSHHLLGQLNIVGTQHPTISTLLQCQWMDLPSTSFILEKQFVLHCGQSVIQQESQRDESAKPTPFSSFLLFL